MPRKSVVWKDGVILSVVLLDGSTSYLECAEFPSTDGIDSSCYQCLCHVPIIDCDAVNLINIPSLMSELYF